MHKALKWGLMGLGGVIVLGGASAGLFVWSQVSAFDESMGKVYEVAPVNLKVETDPETLERGRHLAKSVGGCAIRECHGAALDGGDTIELGPLGTITAPNITSGGLGAVYSDGELGRVVRHGIKKNGKSVTFMTSHEVNWLPDTDLAAIIAYVRSVPKSDKPSGKLELGTLAKILDRQDAFVADVARRIDHDNVEVAIPPEPTAKYGKFIGRLCVGCHGETFGGGPIPGAPPEIPIPSNLTPHETGLGKYSYEDFTRLLDKGTKKDGKPLDKFMPLEALSNMDDTERRALYSFLVSLPPKEFGSR